MVHFTAVHGTMGREAPWAKPGSPLMAFLKAHGVEPLHPDDPFNWSGDVDGWQFWRRWRLLKGLSFVGSDLSDWQAGGSSLRWCLRPERYEDRGLIVHSHGLYPAIEAMAQGLDVPWMISIGSPVRHDMEDRVLLARKHLGAWLHIYDPEWDWWGFWGGAGDGVVSWNRAQRYAGMAGSGGEWPIYMALRPRRGGNDGVRGVRHTRPLENPEQFHLWEDRRWLDFMHEPSMFDLDYRPGLTKAVP